MSFSSLPIEIVTHIFDFLYELDAEMPLDIDEHRNMCDALMALRLTCRELGDIATRQLFRTLYVSPSRVSWLRAHTVAADPVLREHLQTLAFDRFTDRASHDQKIQDAVKSPRLFFLDLSLFPNLNVVKVDDQWMLRKKNRGIVQIPFGCFGISLTPEGTLMEGFENIGRYGFRLASVNIELDDGFWWCIKSTDLSDLRFLRLTFDGFESYKLSLDTDLGHLLQLPNLEEFYLDQFFPHRSDGSPKLDEMTNVLKLLANARNWPRLHHLDLRYLITTVDDLKAFVAPHVAAGTLQTVEIHGELMCAQPTEDEKQKRAALSSWIKTLICSNGVDVTLHDVLGPSDNWNEFENPLSSTEGSLSDVDESYESEDLEENIEGGLRDAEDTDEDSSENGLLEEENPEEQCQTVEY